jgi:hypothetical protein
MQRVAYFKKIKKQRILLECKRQIDEYRIAEYDGRWLLDSVLPLAIIIILQDLLGFYFCLLKIGGGL